MLMSPVESNPTSLSSNPVCQEELDPPADFQHMPFEILSKIVPFIPFDTSVAIGGSLAERVKAKKAINRFIALRKACPELSKFFEDEKTTELFLKSMLHHRRSLGEAPFDSGLNLGPEIVEKVFDSYLRDSDNDFLVLFRLNE